ncbi:MAG: hypothetical protein QOD74_813 [Variibacter sp.]|nr:hypothetical protein [Variibacter sp.]
MTQRNQIGSLGWIGDAVRQNPEGLLLVAAGCALMMRAHSTSTRASASGRHGSRSQFQNSPGQNTRAAERASSVVDQAGEYVSSAQDYAGRIGRDAVEQGQWAAREIQSRAQRIFRQQPLAVVFAGLAGGAAAAAILPETSIEKRTLGPAGDQLSESVSDFGERLKSAGSKATERLMQTAEDKGLNADGLKQVMREVANTLGENLSGSEKASSGNPQQSMSGGSAAGTSPSRSSSPTQTGFSVNTGMGSAR